MLADVYPPLAAKIMLVHAQMMTEHGLSMRVTEGLRATKLQASYWAIGRKQLPDGSWVIADETKIVTRAKPGDSMHEYGLAVDCCFRGTDPWLKQHPDGQALWAAYGRYAQVLGMVWGADWNGNGIHDPNDFDRPHVQLTNGLPLEMIKAYYRAGGTERVWLEVDKAGFARLPKHLS